MSMYPPVKDIVYDSAAVGTVFGNPVRRVWPFSEAPQPGNPLYGVPYATHQLVYGTPQNTLSCPPDMDYFGIQIDVFAVNGAAARAGAAVLRDAFESTGNHVASLDGEQIDEPTGLFRYTFTVDFWTPRSAS